MIDNLTLIAEFIMIGSSIAMLIILSWPPTLRSRPKRPSAPVLQVLPGGRDESSCALCGKERQKDRVLCNGCTGEFHPWHLRPGLNMGFPGCVCPHTAQAQRTGTNPSCPQHGSCTCVTPLKPRVSCPQHGGPREIA